MGKQFKNIFSEDIVVPEIVRLKAEESISKIKKKEGNVNNMVRRMIPESSKASKMSKIFKGCMAACACVACLVGIGYVATTSIRSEKEEMAKLFNMFTLKVYAAESPDAAENGYVTMKPGMNLVISNDDDNEGFVLCESEEGFVTYCISFPVLCEGENIERITYSINEGAFQVVELPNGSIVLDGDVYEGSLNTGTIGGEDSEDGKEILSVTNLYKSFSVSYEEQANMHTWFNICNETLIPWEAVFEESNTLEDQVKSYEEIVKDVLITCTVHYTDGSSEEAIISVGGGVVTPEPTGNPEKDEAYAGFELRYEQ